ncbi:MAG: LexA family transcriptional regulator [Clostridia bacterium]|nr:LexA family transcriptional regulator [Clostridia bacterium]
MNKLIYFNNSFRADNAREANLVGKKLLSARKARGFTQPDIAEQLHRYGIDISAKQVSKWETGEGLPNCYQFIAVCCLLNLDPAVFTGRIPANEEMDDRDLTAEGKQLLSEFRNYLVSTGRYEPRGTIKRCEMLVSNYKASAGIGYNLDNGDDFEKIMVPADRVPAGADFGVRIDGDSMEPVYHDGQLVWIRQTQYLNPGEVGLFIVDGKGYVKVFESHAPQAQFIEDFMDSDGNVRNQISLVSYNEKYDPILLTPDRELRICGKVLN